MPVPVPGAAASPGSSNCNFTNVPPLTWIDGLVDCGIDGLVMSEAVTVALPTVRSVMLKVRVPAENVALPGKVALLSEEVSPARSVTVLTTFQLASTAFTVTLKVVPAVSAPGVPVLPVPVPGAAVSPGVRSWSFVNAPAVTGMDELVFAVIPV